MSLKSILFTNILCTLLILSDGASGQAISHMEISYSMEYSGMDTLRPNTFRCDAVLSQKGRFSIFQLKLNQDSLLEKEIGYSMMLVSKNEFSFMKDFERDLGYFYDEVFTDKKTLYKDTLHPMAWHFTGRNKMIQDSLLCYEATTHFRGRQYSAWYYPKIPASNGPWKMGGLPGVILEMQDSHGLLKFQFQKMTLQENSASVSRDLQIPSKKEIAAAKSMVEFRRNMRSFVENLMNMASLQKDDCINCQTTFSMNVNYWEKFSE